jgi:hypothetical protein
VTGPSTTGGGAIREQRAGGGARRRALVAPGRARRGERQNLCRRHGAIARFGCAVTSQELAAKRDHTDRRERHRREQQPQPRQISPSGRGGQARIGRAAPGASPTAELGDGTERAGHAFGKRRSADGHGFEAARGWPMAAGLRGRGRMRRSERRPRAEARRRHVACRLQRARLRPCRERGHGQRRVLRRRVLRLRTLLQLGERRLARVAQVVRCQCRSLHRCISSVRHRHRCCGDSGAGRRER